MDNPVWYVAYGSNMAAARFRCYVDGGRPVGASRTLPGCRDPSFPAQWRRALIPGAVYYALESLTWTGGMACYDPDLAGYVAARTWLVRGWRWGRAGTRPSCTSALSRVTR